MTRELGSLNIVQRKRGKIYVIPRGGDVILHIIHWNIICIRGFNHALVIL